MCVSSCLWCYKSSFILHRRCSSIAGTCIICNGIPSPSTHWLLCAPSCRFPGSTCSSPFNRWWCIAIKRPNSAHYPNVKCAHYSLIQESLSESARPAFCGFWVPQFFCAKGWTGTDQLCRFMGQYKGRLEWTNPFVLVLNFWDTCTRVQLAAKAWQQ